VSQPLSNRALWLLLLAVVALAAGSVAWVVHQQRQQAVITAHIERLRPILLVPLIPEGADYQRQQLQFRRDADALLRAEAGHATPLLLELLPWSKLLIERIDRQLADTSALLNQLNHWSSLGSRELLASGELAQVASQLVSAGRFYQNYQANLGTMVDDVSQQLATASIADPLRQPLLQLWQQVMSHDASRRDQRALELGNLLVASGELFGYIDSHRAQLQPDAMEQASPEQRLQLATELKEKTSAMNQALAAWQPQPR